MQIAPDRTAVLAALSAGRNQLVWTKLVADMDTPVSLMLKLGEAGPMSFLLESVTGGEIRGRYSVIGLAPDLVWRCRGDAAEINRTPETAPDAYVPDDRPSLASLRALIAASEMVIPDGLPPMAAGLFGYLGYDMIRLVERLGAPNPDPLGLPDAMLLRPGLVAIIDNIRAEVTLVAPIWAETVAAAGGAEAAHGIAVARLEEAVERIDRAAAPTPVTPIAGADGVLKVAASALSAAQSNTTHARYLEMVEQAKDHIRAGDIFQVVPSQRWALALDAPPFALYRALRRINPSPYMFYFDLGGFQVVGASPEILVRLRGGTVTIRPIAGTRPRGATPEEDRALEADLLADPKERAEHLMLLDLGRNDVGRVAEIGTVTPTETYTVERYSHVMHIVSNVEGRLSDEHDALSALLAGLPAGTVSGAPKIRAMEIIDELESEKRGVYAGAVGYFSADGEMDTCIALRTGVVKDGILYVQAGGGVVYDSEPEAEYQETVNKAKSLMHAAAIARGFN